MKQVTTHYSNEQVEQLNALARITGEKIATQLSHALDMYLDHARHRGLLVDPRHLDQPGADEFSGIADAVIEAA